MHQRVAESLRSAAMKGLRTRSVLRSLRDSLRSPLTAASLRLESRQKQPCTGPRARIAGPALEVARARARLLAALASGSQQGDVVADVAGPRVVRHAVMEAFGNPLPWGGSPPMSS